MNTETTTTTPALAAQAGSRRERPILFSGPMVRAIIDGRKTQTRRIIKPQPVPFGTSAYQGTRQGWKWKPYSLNRGWNDDDGSPYNTSPLALANLAMACECPYGAPGDRLWVRESGWERPDRTPRMMREGADTWEPYYFDADGLTEADLDDFKRWGFRRRPSIHMPRWASRITLEIVAVRVERLRDISEDDARHEGAQPMKAFGNLYVYTRSGAPFQGSSYRDGFKWLWDTINGHGSWDLNPWVWVMEFKTSNTQASDGRKEDR